MAGAYSALHAAGREPDRIAGTSIGAITGALIAGNPPELRVSRLREFWRRSQSLAGGLFGSPRREAQVISALQARLFGRPAVFTPRLLRLSSDPERLGLYDSGPLRATLLDLIDFDRLNEGAPRLSLIATDLASGEPVISDTARDRIGVEHLLASAALIPDFSPVRVDGRLLVDGGLSDNLPIDVVLRDATDWLECFAVDLFPLARASVSGEQWEPTDLLDLAERQSDLSFAGQTRRTIVGLTREDALRRDLAAARGGPPPPSVALWLVSYAPGPEEAALKTWDYSDAALSRRWAAGEADMDRALMRSATLGQIQGLHVEDGHAGGPAARG